MKKKKLIYFTDTIGFGGAELSLKSYLLNVDLNKYEVRLAIPKKFKNENYINELKNKKIIVDRLNFSILDRYYKILWYSLKYLLNNRTGIYHFNMQHPESGKYTILLTLLFPKIKVFATVRYIQNNMNLTKKYKIIRHLNNKKFSKVIAISEDVKKLLIKLCKTPVNKIVVIH